MPPPVRLTSRILHPHDPSPSAEDIFSSALETLFTDDTQQSHGMPGQSIIYQSPRFGDVHLQVPTHPDEEGGRLLFAHYLWNAGVIAAEGIERGSCDDQDDEESSVPKAEEREVHGTDGESAASRPQTEQYEMVRWDKRFWDMRGRDVLELGAATALPSLIATLSNARTVVSTDHPSSPAITMNTIASNFRINITERARHSASTKHTTNTTREFSFSNDGVIPPLYHPPVTTRTHVSIYGYVWGTTTFHDTKNIANNSANSTQSSHSDIVPPNQHPNRHSFDRIIIADCLWMPEQHENLVKTVLDYLSIKNVGHEAENGNDVVPCALVIAGFHTGRAVVKNFIEIATGSPLGVSPDGLVSSSSSPSAAEATTIKLEVEDTGNNSDVRGKLKAADIFEVDIEGRQRPWVPERPRETKEESKRWCVYAILVRR